MKQLSDARIKGSFLIASKGERGIQIPNGLISYGNEVRYETDGHDIIAIMGDEKTIIHPISTVPTLASSHEIIVRPAVTFKDIREGRQLLLEHYMGVPMHGLIINAYIDGRDAPIACGCLDRLYYANPKGRTEIAKARWGEEGEAKLKLLNRSDSVKQLRIAWISRLVVAEDYRKMGIGTAMAEAMGKIAHCMMLPHADFLEVFISFPKGREEVYMSDSNLYIKAGFTRVGGPLKSPQMVFPDMETDGKPDGYVTTKKLYFFKDLRGI